MKLGPYELGPNDTPEQGIYCGDTRELSKAIPDESVDLIVADPPYFQIATGDWDHQWRSVQDWAEWCLDWGEEAARILRPNGSAYIYGDDKNIAYLQVGFDTLGWGLLNHIVWSKTNYTMLKASPEAMRSYRMQGEERILFYGKDITFPSFSEIRNPKAAQPMAAYLRSERERAGVTAKEVAGAIGAYGKVNHGGAVSNWETGYNFPSKEQYEAIREYLNSKNGDEYLRHEYEYLRHEYEDLRRPFYAGILTDVWVGPAISAAHKTREAEKPHWINRRMIEASTMPDSIVLDMFTGSGSLPAVCKQLGRQYLAFEIDPDTCDIARQRVRDTQPPLFVLEPESEQLTLME